MAPKAFANVPDPLQLSDGIQPVERPISGSRFLSIAAVLSALVLCVAVAVNPVEKVADTFRVPSAVAEKTFSFPWRLHMECVFCLPSFNGIAVGGIAAVHVGATTAQGTEDDQPDSSSHLTAVTESTQGDDGAPGGDPSVGATAATDHLYPVTIRRPSGPPHITTSVTDLNGNQVTVACSTCHATRTPNLSAKVSGDLDEFHGGMSFSHGTISCLSCHHERDYDALKLADGSRVEFSDVMTLCGQCHGPQQTAYEHGAHGGMTGYWDRTRGPQIKNNCVDCHNPHTPQFPRMRPTFKPRDRFLDQPRTDH